MRLCCPRSWKTRLLSANNRKLGTGTYIQATFYLNSTRGQTVVTITQSEEETFQAEIGDFHAQHFEDQCYPAAIKNIVDRLAKRKDKNGMKMSLSDVNEICGYKRGLQCEEDLIPERLTNELHDYGYETRQKTAPEMDLDKLESVIQDEDTSLPIVELDPEYFEHVEERVDGYRMQHTVERELAHVVIPYKVNSEEILYYDPYEKFHEKQPGVEDAPYRWPLMDFVELWSGDYEERWTLWLARRGYELTDIEDAAEE